jgi:DNA transposition AAA+ family ATPase
MERNYNPDIQARLEAYVLTVGSQAKAAKAIGLSDSVISQYRRSSYDKGNIPEVEGKLSVFFELIDEKQAATEKAEPYQPVQDNYIPTSISEDIYKSIRFCQLSKGIAVLHGDAGVGKTKAAEQYAIDNPGTAVYIQVSPVTGSLGSFLKMLTRALHISEGRSKLDMIINIRDRLDGTSKVLIIDEAQHLRLSALEEIRTLSDMNMITGRQGIGIVLIGNTEVYDRMRGRQQANFAQLFSRIRMNRAYSTRQVKRDDVIKLFPGLYEKGMQKELDYIYGICQSRWGIRGGVNVYNNAVASENISYDGLNIMARNMGIGLV